jgi:hypothetical protein
MAGPVVTFVIALVLESSVKAMASLPARSAAPAPPQGRSYADAFHNIHSDETRRTSIRKNHDYDFNLFGIGVVDLYPREFVFDQDRQLETIEPVGAKILTEMRLIYHASDIDTQPGQTSGRRRSSIPTKTPQLDIANHLHDR